MTIKDDVEKQSSDILGKLSQALIQISRGDPIVALRSELETRFNSITTRFAAIDKATELQHEDQVRVPTQIDKAIANLHDLLQQKISTRIAEVRGLQMQHVAESSEKLNRIEQVLAQMQVSETRRIDQLAQTRQEFQNTIRDMLAESVRTTSTLVSTQLVQIQATFDTRVSKLEAGAFTQAGKQSVADPQLADFMRAMSQNLSTQSSSTTELIAKMGAENMKAIATLTATVSGLGSIDKQDEGRRMGQGQVIAWIVAGFMLLAALAGPIIAIVSMRAH